MTVPGPNGAWKMPERLLKQVRQPKTAEDLKQQALKTVTQSFLLRPYADSDLEATVALWQRCNLTIWYNDPEQDIALFQASDNARITLAVSAEGTIAGSICHGHDGHRGWIYYLAVDPDIQGSGLGRQLSTAAEDWMRDQGIPKVQLMIRSSNHKVAGFYESIGYEEEPRRIFSKWLKDKGLPPEDQRPDIPEGATVEDGVIDKKTALSVTVTDLEMLARPEHAPAHPPSNLHIALLKTENCTVSFYRYLYNTVGEPWLWYEKRLASDETLAEILARETTDLYVLYVEGVPAGFFQLDHQDKNTVDLAYFGLVPDYIGMKLGPYLLDTAIQMAWDKNPKRLTVNTCTLDHPKALPLYQKLGFVPFRQQVNVIVDPRSKGVI
ncbi:GNAT family acetyltransferase [Rhodovibrionaceae bacterium A322]